MPTINYTTQNPVSEAVWWACNIELAALKPGNVGHHGDGHGMRVDDFVYSARAIAPPLGEPRFSVGERIYRSIQATRHAVGCNTNLGIVLLAAPLAHGVCHGTGTIRQRLRQTLQGLDVADAEHAFAAIRLAQPAGLGAAGRYDVADRASADLLTVMRSAAGYDRIAYQYASDYEDVFDLGLPVLNRALQDGADAGTAASETYLNFLARFADTHIRRKLGAAKAEAVRRAGQRLLRAYRSSIRHCAGRERIATRLLEFDDGLKRRGINPGTSADLTVATLLAYRLSQLELEKVAVPRPETDLAPSLLAGARGSPS